MEIKPIASDSMGVRSMATLVTTGDCQVLLDPGAALGPIRYSLPPLKAELKALASALNTIGRIARNCQILTISHYHYDHYLPEADIYKDKIVYAKDPKNNINKSIVVTDFSYMRLIM